MRGGQAEFDQHCCLQLQVDRQLPRNREIDADGQMEDWRIAAGVGTGPSRRSVGQLEVRVQIGQADAAVRYPAAIDRDRGGVLADADVYGDVDLNRQAIRRVVAEDRAKLE